MASPITSAKFDVVNFEGDICSQLRQLLQISDNLKIWFAWAFDANGNATNEFIQQFASVFIPTGTLLWSPANYTPDGYLIANGQEVSKTTYAKLFAIWGTSFGVASNPTDNFKVPDMTGRFPIGAGGSYQLYVPGGEALHTLTVLEMPSHTHTVVPFNMPIQGFLPGSGVRDLGPGNDTGDVTLDVTGGGQPHNNIPPYVAGYWLIKAL